MTIRLPQLVIVRLLQRCFNIRNVTTIVLIIWAQQTNFIWSIEIPKLKLIDLGKQKVGWQDLCNSVRRSIQVRATMYLTLFLIIGHGWRNSSSPHLKSQKCCKEWGWYRAEKKYMKNEHGDLRINSEIYGANLWI